MPVDVRLKRMVSASRGDIRAADFHSTKPWLITGHQEGIVNIYNHESGAFIHTFSLPSDAIRCVKFIVRKNWYVVGSGDGTLHIFNCTTHEKVVAFKAHFFYITCLAVHPISPIVLTGSMGGIKAWDWDNRWHNIQTYEGRADWITSIALNPKDPNTFATGYYNGTVRMWSIASPIPHFTIKAHNWNVNCVDFYPDVNKPYFITAGGDSSLKIWDYLSQSCVQTIQDHTNLVTFAVFHPNLPIIISGSEDGTVKIWNGTTYGIEQTLGCGPGSANCIALHKYTSEVVVGSGKCIATLELSHSGPSQMRVTRGDMSGEALKEQIHGILGGRDVKDPSESMTLRPEQGLDLAQISDSLTITYNTSLSLPPHSTTPSQSHRVHQPKADRYEQCSTLVMEVMADKVTNKLISQLRDERAQGMADFLSKMVNDEATFTQRDRKYLLHLLSKLAKLAVVFPRSLALEGAQCSLANPVAWGGYGVIYKGEYEGGLICVKVVQADSQGVDEKKLKAHASELTIWGHLRHPNVLPFLGIYASKEEVSRTCIVSPWMNNGDLLQYLKAVPAVPRKPLVHDIVSGLQYLHNLDVIHADLKAKNVLVSEAGRAMLADFGISRLSMTQTTMLTNVGAGSANWMAPELLLEQKAHSRESDIWAFACTCYEILTLSPPFRQYYMAPLLIGAFMMNKLVPPRPEEPRVGWDEDVWSVAIQCWKSDPASRPEATELLDIIKNFNFPDGRPSDLEYRRSRCFTEIDYDRIFRILHEIRQAATVKRG